MTDLFPCFYGGGGSCAFDREKFLELGGFDPLLEPFYLEDGDVGYMAWKRGWKVFYQPRSVVFHEHRGTIGKRFSEAYIQAVLKKNFLLFCWKNIHEWRRLAAHFCFTWAGAVIGVAFGDVPGRPNLGAMWRAFRQLPQAVRSRRRARRLARISDTEAFLRPMGGYYRDRFATIESPPSNTAESKWGGPPGPRPAPWPASFRERNEERGSGGTRADQGVRPTLIPSASSLSRPTPSARRSTAAACSCTKPCVKWRSWPRYT